MTVQSKDILKLRELNYTILGRGDGPLFDPNQVGIKPGWNSSANWRGFTSTYAIVDNCLILDDLRVNVNPRAAQSDILPRLFGKHPEVSSVRDRLRAAGFEHFEHLADAFVMTYAALAAPMPYCGPLLLVRDWLDEELLLNFFSDDAWEYADVRELILDNGRIAEERDRSSVIAVSREKFLAMTENEQSAQMEEISHEISGCFSAEYDYRY